MGNKKFNETSSKGLEVRFWKKDLSINYNLKIGYKLVKNAN